MATYNIEALTLRKRDFGEADSLLTLFSREKGKMTAVARGVRKSGAKLSALTEAIALNNFQLAEGRMFDIVTQVQSLNSFSKIRGSLQRLMFAIYWCELIDQLVHEGEPNTQLFELVEQGLKALQTFPNPESALRWHEFELLSALGYEPVVHTCAKCEKPPVGAWAAFSLYMGGLLCQRCSLSAKDSVRVPFSTVEALQELRSSPSPPEELRDHAGLSKMLKAIWRTLLDKDPRCAQFLEDLLERV